MPSEINSQEIVELIESGKISQERKIGNDMLQHYSPERLKLELAKYKKETLSILSYQLDKKVTETEIPSPVVHTIVYSGYFINEEQFDKVKEILGCQTQETEKNEQQQ